MKYSTENVLFVFDTVLVHTIYYELKKSVQKSG